MSIKNTSRTINMTVFRSSGYCWGVKRAVEIVSDTLKKCKKAYILGDIIHNTHTNSEMKKRGLVIVKRIEDIPEKSVFFYPSHGIKKTDEEKAKSNKLKIISLVCPFVLNIQQTAIDYEKRGYDIIIYGDPEHTEVKAIVSRLKRFSVILSPNDIDRIKPFKKAVFISQSTQNKKSFYELFLGVSKSSNWEELIGKYTICNETLVRQEWINSNLNNYDLFVIIGAKNSSNTKKLYEIVISGGKKGMHIEDWEGDIYKRIKKFKNIAMISGTSTPIKVIEDIKKMIEKEAKEDGSKISINYA